MMGWLVKLAARLALSANGWRLPLTILFFYGRHIA
jgi:hypothetical protein